jgi:hypothetical protein
MATKTITLEIPANNAVKFETMIRELVAKMDRARKQMKRDQAEIDRLKARTRATLAELKAMR